MTRAILGSVAGYAEIGDGSCTGSGTGYAYLVGRRGGDNGSGVGDLMRKNSARLEGRTETDSAKRDIGA